MEFAVHAFVTLSLQRIDACTRKYSRYFTKLSVALWDKLMLHAQEITF